MDGAWRRPTASSLCSGTPSPSEVPSGGARAFCLLLRFSKVSRRQGGTLSGRYRSNGYVHNPTVLTARPPSRASPHTVGWWVVRERSVGWQAVIAGKPAPTIGSGGVRERSVGWQAVIAGKPAPTLALPHWRCSNRGQRTASKSPVAPIPPPTHMVTIP